MIKNLSVLFSHLFTLAFLSLLMVAVLFSFILPEDVYSLSIKLVWNKTEGDHIYGYRMFCREEGQNYNYIEPSWEGSNTTCIISNLDSHKTYFFVLRAVNILNIESANSNEVKYEHPQNLLPKVFNQEVTTQENKSLDITLTATDDDDHHLTYIFIDLPLHGELFGTPPAVTYFPNADYNGPDSFTFMVNDGKADSNIAVIKVSVNSVNDPPEANAGLDQKVDEEVTITLDASNSSDRDDNTDTDDNKDKFIDEIEFNNVPSAPAINYPPNNSEIDTIEIFLSVNNAKDPEEQTLTYTFEIYYDQSLNSLVTSISGIQEEENTTSWGVDTLLEDNSFYYWRARAFDGVAYSEWMNTAKFFLNNSNDAPSIPSLSAPPDKSEVWTLQPTLEVNNASDKDMDPLKYKFEVYLDQNIVCTKTVLIEGSAGTTSWRINTQLKDNTHYCWRVQAIDNEEESSDWTNLFQFFVNTSNDAPSIPTISSPKNTQEVDTLFPILEVKNSQDIDLNQDKLTYLFEIDKSKTFNTFSHEKSLPILEGTNITSWSPHNLEDNSMYYWRAMAYDGAAYSPWAMGSFFVNLYNDAPTIPTINNPGNNTTINTSRPVLAINPSTDVDLDQIAYEFELYLDSNMSDLMSTINSTETSCIMDVNLGNNQMYCWRARAIDEHGATSDWSDIVSFWTNIKYRPTTPIINNPASGGIVTSLTPTLSVNNSNDPDNEALYYKFELFLDKDLSYKVASSTKIFQRDIITSWNVAYPLSDNTTYYWRVRASDEELTSEWMQTALFTVDISGSNIIMYLESSQDVSATAQATQKIDVTNSESPINSLSLEIPPGALSNDCTITIGLISNPPALPDNTKAIGKVIELGPSGITFSEKISILIPYSQEDLDNAGVTDPLQLEVFTYNTSTLLWESIRVDDLDRANSLLICKTDHFSMFTTGISVGTIPQKDNAEHLEFGGDCFIESITLNYKSVH